MEKQSITVHSKNQDLSSTDFKKELVSDPTKKTANLLFAQLLLQGKREDIELWRFFDINIFLEVVTKNFDKEQIATIYKRASIVEEETRQTIKNIDSDPEAFAHYYTHETDKVNISVGMETVRSEYIPNGEMHEIIAELETFELITTKLAPYFDEADCLAQQEAGY